MSTSPVLAPTRHSRTPYLILAGIILIGAFLRIYGLHQLPPGLHHDEVVDAGDALRIVRGEFPIYFEANNGREPAFMYALALGIAVAGWSPFTLRLVSSVAGILAIPIAYQALRQFLGRRVGVLGAFLYAGTFWPVQLSHLATPLSILPAATGLAMWGVGRAWHRDRRRDWLLAGCLFGLALYTYLPARLALLVPLSVAAIGLASGINRRRLLRASLFFLVAYGLVVLPLVWYALGHWDIFMARPGQVAIFKAGAGLGALVQTALNQALVVVPMFLLRGDSNWRHNLPGRPVFDWLMGLAFLIGLAVGVKRWRERRIQWMWAWLGVFLLPTLLADSALHFLRSSGLWPGLAVWPALGVITLKDLLERRAGRLISVGLSACVLAGSLFATVRDYYWRDYLTSPMVYYAFGSFAVQLATDVNVITGQGWGGYGRQLTPKGEVWIEPRIYNFLDTIAVMIPVVPGPQAPVHFLAPDTSAGPLAAPNARLIFVPGQEPTYFPMLPRRSEISLRDGSYANDTADIHPYLFYRMLTATPAVDLPAPVACFAPGVRLLPPRIQLTADQVQVDLSWQAAVDGLPNYTVFLHAYQGDAIVVQRDSYPVNGLVPFSWLRADDVIDDPRSLTVTVGTADSQVNRLGIGLYLLATGQRSPATDCLGHPIGDEYSIPMAP